MTVFLFSASRFVVIHLVMLWVAAIADIVFLGFRAFTVTCFSVAGVFAAVFCYGTMPEGVAANKNGTAAFYTLIAVLFICALLFFLGAPFSGGEYSLPVKSFAVTEALTTIFLWKIKHHDENKKL